MISIALDQPGNRLSIKCIISFINLNWAKGITNIMLYLQRTLAAGGILRAAALRCCIV